MEKSHSDHINILNGEWALLPHPSTRPLFNGIIWLWRAAKLFGQYWLHWLGLGVFITLCQAIIWVLSQQMSASLLLLPLLMLMFSAGILNAASVQEFDREPPQFSHLFTALESGSNYTHLITFYLLLLVTVIGLGYYFNAYLLYQYRYNPSGLTFPLCLAAAAWALLWFAPALVFLQGETLLKAIVLSIKSTFFNLFPMLLLMICQLLLAGGVVSLASLRNHNSEYALLLGVSAIAAWVFFQVFGLLCCYTSYRDIWFKHIPYKPAPAVSRPTHTSAQPVTQAAVMPAPAAITRPIKTHPTQNRCCK